MIRHQAVSRRDNMLAKTKELERDASLQNDST
jgi:hypothetical protein